MGDVEGTKADYKSIAPWDKKKGGFRASAFVYVFMALENMGFIANMVSLVLYFLMVMHFDIPSSSNTLTNFMGSTFLLTLVGGFISDTYLNRLHTILFFGTIEILALVLVTIQAATNHLHPKYCGKPTCVEGKIAVMLYASLSLLALGTGGVRGALPALGAEQFNQKDPKGAKALASYFNYAILCTVLGATVGVTLIVWVSMNKAWYKGFMISTVATFVGLVVLVLGKPFYRLQEPGDQSPIARIMQVFVMAFKNRGLSLPKNADELYEIDDKETISAEDKLPHTNQFRFLDKAAIVRNDSEASAQKTCTVTQVEEVKILTRMLPILASTIIMNTCMAQLQTFSVQQGNSMNRFLHKFEVPAPSVPVIPLVFMIILIPIYEFIFVPFARKITGHPSGITQLQRVGVGLVLSAISMAVAGIIEAKRRHQSLKDRDHPISLFWLSFQYGIFGIADMFTLVGLMEFFYKEAPSGMKSLATSFTWLSLSLGYFLSTVLVDIINGITRRVSPSKQGWLHGIDLDQNNLNLFYWFLAILSLLNFANYLYWASWYKYKGDDTLDSKPTTKVLEDGLCQAKVEASTEKSTVVVANTTNDTISKIGPESKTQEKEVNTTDPKAEEAPPKSVTFDSIAESHCESCKQPKDDTRDN